MDPPPAPMDSTATMGWRRGRPPRVRSLEIWRLPGEDEADVGGGAAHVEADGAIDAEVPGDAAGRGHPRRRPGGGETERQLAQRLRRGHASRGVEQVQPRPGRLRGVESIEVARGQRHDAGAQGRRRGALVLTRLGIHSVRECHEGEAPAQPLAERLLVSGIGVRVQQRYRDRLGAAVLDAANDFVDRAGVHRIEHPAIVIEPLAHFEPELGRHLGGELGRKVEAVEVAPVLASDGQGVGEASSGDEGDLREIVLDDGIGHERGAVNQVVHVRPDQIDRPERGQQPGHAILGAGRDLGDSGGATRAVHRDHVGERAADVDSDPPIRRS